MSRLGMAALFRLTLRRRGRRRAGALLAAALALVAAPAHGDRSAKASRKRGQGSVVLDRVVAVVNDEVILKSELLTRVTPLTSDLEEISDPREQARRSKKLTEQVLEDMIAEELIIHAAREAKLDVTEREINSAIDDIKRQHELDDAGLDRALAMQGYTKSSYRQEMRRQILRMRAVNTLVRPRVTVTDEDVRARYDELGRRSAAVSQVRLHHALLSLPPKPSEAEIAAAKARAAELITRIRSGESFAELVQQYSDDANTKEDGGDLGWIERGSLATDWEVIVFAMDQGEVRGPISGPRGLHVFYVSDVRKSDLKTFDELKEQLRAELVRTEMDKQTRLWLDELRKKAHVVKLPLD